MKTVLDLHLSAAAAAMENLGDMNKHSLHLKTTELCLKDGFAPEDYDIWFEVFVDRRAYYRGLKMQRLPSEILKAPVKPSPIAGQPAAVPAESEPKPNT